MDTKKVPIVELLSLKRLNIPVYQRNYSWGEKDCKRLFSDITSLIEDTSVSNNENDYFLGCIVSVKQGKGTRYIIDGQQRLTSVTLLCLAIYHIVIHGDKQVEDEHLASNLFTNYLAKDSSLCQNYMNEIKLHLNPDDQEALEALFLDNGKQLPQSRVTANYNYFRKLVLKSNYGIQQIIDAIENVVVVDILLEQYEEPQRVFESLNSTGVGLTESDKIRNYILMDLPGERQDALYKSYWREIETCCNLTNTENAISDFFSTFLTLKNNLRPAKNQVYSIFQKTFSKTEVQNEEFLKELLACARRYSYLLAPFHQPLDSVIDKCVYRINYIKRTIVRPFFLEVLRLYECKQLSLDDTRQVFLLTETYLVRKAVCHNETNALNKVFTLLYREVINIDKTANQFLDKVTNNLLSRKQGSGTEFPTDEEFTQAFSQSQTYTDLKNYKEYLLERLECYDHPESIDVYTKLNDKEISVEHIMPQKLNEAWRNELGPDANDIWNNWIHRIANLTFSAYNNSMSNSPFRIKKDKGYSESGFHLNKYIASCSKWTLKELEARNIILTEKALQIWSRPKNSYTPPTKSYQECTLKDAPFYDMKGLHPVRFKYEGTEYSVNNWKKLTVGVIRLLYGINPSLIDQILKTSEPRLSSSFQPTKEKKAGKEPEEIAPGIYFNICNCPSAKDKITFLHRLFEYYSIDKDKLIFSLSERKPRQKSKKLF